MNSSSKNTSAEAEVAPPAGLDIWQFSADVSNRLMVWNAVNIGLGVQLSRGAGFLRGIGSQGIGWGLINMAIGLIGRRSGGRRYEALENPYENDVQRRDTRNLRLLLAVNGALDVLYMLGGLRYARGARDSFRRGMGIGIVIQGALLFLFDWQMFRRSFFLIRREAATDKTP